MRGRGGSGLAVVISGPSGAGKTTVCKRLAEQHGYDVSVSATTRAPRQGERDGKEYFFLTREAFEAGVRRGEFLEFSEHFNNLYGTPRAGVAQALKEGRVILLEIDVNGAVQVMEGLPEALCIFLSAPDDRENERRLRSRHSDDEASIRTRLQRADMEKALKMRYDRRVVNNDLDQTVQEIHELITAEVNKRNGS